MKIGIVTFQRADNQGALLQCYALYNALKKMECDAQVIDYRNDFIENQYKIFPKKSNFLQYCKSWLRGAILYVPLKRRRKNFEKLRRRIQLSDSLSLGDFKENNFDYDLIIAGSDQVWNSNITRGFDDVYFLNFSGNFIRAGYAVSLGSINNTDYKSERFKELLSAFDFLSIREKDAVDFVSGITSKSVVQCLDPTLLLSETDWSHLTKDAEINTPKRYILLYYVQKNPELIRIAEKLSKERGIPVIYFEATARLKCKSICKLDSGPMEFVKLIQNAETIITSSFHAAAFSCIFKKDVHIITHSVTGARVVSLADIFKINHRIYSSYSDFEKRYDPEECLKYNTEEYSVQLEKSVNYLKEIISAARRNSSDD